MTPHRIGDIELMVLSDGFLDIPTERAMCSTALIEQRFSEAGRSLPPRLPVNCFVIRSGGRVALVDTGAADSMGPTLGRLGAALEGAGVAPAAVDVVMLTHIHPDHSNGLRDEAGAVFGNAELVMHAAELAFWCDAERRSDNAERRVRQEVAHHQVAPYRDRLRLFDGEAEVFPGVTAVPMPGHTPGHSGYLIASGGDNLLIWGDITHIPELQVPNPEVAMVFDVDPAQAVETRRAVFERVVSDGLNVAGMHVPGRGFLRLERAGGGWRHALV